jgi:hypothetical protein
MTESLRLSVADFEKAKAKLIKLSAEVNHLARLVLVDGETLTAAAASIGMSKQNASKHMRRVRALLNDQPATWVHLDEWVPDWLAAETRAKLQVEKDKIKIKQ